MVSAAYGPCGPPDDREVRSRPPGACTGAWPAESQMRPPRMPPARSSRCSYRLNCDACHCPVPFGPSCELVRHADSTSADLVRQVDERVHLALWRGLIACLGNRLVEDLPKVV